MSLKKLNIPSKIDNASKQRLVASNVIGSNETLLATEFNEIVNKTNELVEAYNFGTPITAFNFKKNVETYADLLELDSEVNDGYGVKSDGLIYVWNGNEFPQEGNGMNLGLKPPLESKVESENDLAVSGKEVFRSIYIGTSVEIPQGYKNASYNTYLSPEKSYYDSRCFVSNAKELAGINLVSFGINIGEIHILAISTLGKVLHSELKKLTIDGLNVTNFTDLSSVKEPFYVGFRLISNQFLVCTNHPPDSDGFTYWQNSLTDAFIPLQYRLAYSIEKNDGGIKGELSTFEILTKSDTTKIQQSLNQSKKVVFDKNSVVIEDIVDVPNGAMMEGVFGSTTLQLNNSAAFLINGKEDIALRGLKFKGTQPNYAYSMNGINSGSNIIEDSSQAIRNLYKGPEVGMEIKASENIILENLQFHNINGVGLVVDRVGRDYIKGLKASKLFFANCYKGIETKNEAEYSNFTDIMISLCQIGMDQDSGNLNVSNPIITRCRYGMIIRGSGLNHAHGIVNGAEIKHHQLAGILFHNVNNGHYFNGLMMQYANLEFENSRMITIPDLYFSNGSIICNNTDKTGINLISKLYKASSITINNNGNLSIQNEIDMY